MIEPEHDRLLDARRRRSAVVGAVAALAPEIGRTCAAMAERFAAGAVLHPMGVGVSAVDAAHVTVEFIHPVIVGKRALPALTLAPAQVGLAVPGSIVLAIRLGRGEDIDAALRAARERGCTTIDLCAGEGHTVDVDHRLSMPTDDRLVAREMQVTTYHVIWELVHEFLDGGSSNEDGASSELSELYPFLYGPSGGDERGTVAHVVQSTEAKGSEIDALRARVLDDQHAGLNSAADALAQAAGRGSIVWTFGNGGSSTDAQAFAMLLGDRLAAGSPLSARSLTDDVATLTALANDVSFEVVFARALRSLARPGDVAVGFSTSGGSRNVLAAFEAATSMGLATVGFAGYDGGDMADVGLDHLFVVPSSSVHRIQEAQTSLAHVLVELARSRET